MHSAALLAKENSDLREANARQTRKRQLKRYFISTEIALQAQQAQQLVDQIANRGQKDSEKGPVRAPYRCSQCREQVTQRDDVLIFL